jgi:hypothetical protein
LQSFNKYLAVMERHDADTVIYDEGGTARSGGTIRGRKSSWPCSPTSLAATPGGSAH